MTSFVWAVYHGSDREFMVLAEDIDQALSRARSFIEWRIKERDLEDNNWNKRISGVTLIGKAFDEESWKQ